MQLIGDLAVGLYSSAAADSSGVAKSKLISVGYGEATASSIVDIQSGVVIDAGETAVVTSDAAATAEIETETSRDLGEGSRLECVANRAVRGHLQC